MRRSSRNTGNERKTDDLRVYRASDVAASLASDDPNVRMFAILDRRVGKRTLTRLREGAVHWPGWLRAFYDLRAAAEGLPTTHE